MPFYNLKLEASKPLPNKYPREIRSLGNLIRAARLGKGLLQKEVANIIGVDTCTIENWELGRSIPRQRSITEIKRFVSDLECAKSVLEIGQILKARRESDKMTQRQMAEKLSMSLNTYRGIELGNLSIYPRNFESVQNYLLRTSSPELT